MLCAPCICGDNPIVGVAGAAVGKCPLASAGTILQGIGWMYSCSQRGEEMDGYGRGFHEKNGNQG